ncbi:PaaI family thioesterase [Actinomarinicola tropica]|nr:PaaI family thioesterase [Actinomarinicola tropica]
MPEPVTPDRYDTETAAAMTAMAGQLDGLPTYLGIRTTHVGPAVMTAELDVRPDLLNPFGTLHGGVLSALVDHVLGAVLYPVIERGRWAATTEFKLNLLAAVRDGTLTARSTIVSLTRRTAVVQVEVDNDGRLCGLAQGTVLIAQPRQPDGDR